MNAVTAMTVSGRKPQAPLKVLILDDDAFDRKRVRRWIERNTSADVVMTEIADLADFKNSIRQRQFDLVLMDYALADGTGLDALNLIRSHPNQAQSYTVMISGREDDRLRNLCLREGCDQFISKSSLGAVRIGQLIECVCTRKWSAELPKRGPRQSALAYWRLQAERRSAQVYAGHKTENLAVLRDRLGLELDFLNDPEKSANEALSTFVLNETMSVALRLFIDDFLSCDEFDFTPVEIAPQTAPIEKRF